MIGAPLFSGRWFDAGRHSVALPPSAARARGGGPVELVVVSSAGVEWDWEGVVGNTGPVTGPGALKGLGPPQGIAIAGDQAVWCLGYNERQPSCFVFNVSSPQVSVPVSSPNFERLYGAHAFDGTIAYLANVGNTPESNSYYHLPETFVLGIDLTRRSNHTPQFCMHNWTAPGATTEVCSTGTSRPLPPWHCRTDGCVSTSNPETFLALDFTRRNVTVPPACNSNGSWPGQCHYQAQPTGITVQRRGDLLLVARGFDSPSEVRLFHKVTGASLGRVAVEGAGPLALSADEKSFWTIRAGDGAASGRVSRFAAADSGAHDAPPEIAAVTALPTACSMAVHPTTDDLWVVDRKMQRVRVFPPTGGAAGVADRPWGASLNLSFPYVPSSSTGSVGMGSMVCATLAFSDDGSEVWVTDPANRRIIRVNVATEAVVDTVMFLTVSYASAVDWANPTRVFSNFLEFEVDYTAPLSPSSGWRFVRNWGTGAAAEYHADVGLTHWSFAGFLAVVTVGGRTLAQVSVSPNDLDPVPSRQEDGEAVAFVELDGATGALRPIATFCHGCNVNLHPDGSLRQALFDHRTNRTTVGVAPWDASRGNWSLPFATVANVSQSPNGRSPRFNGAEQGPAALVMDVEAPAAGAGAASGRLLILNEAGNSPNFTRFHLGAVRWSPRGLQGPGNDGGGASEWVWTASPGKAWVTENCNMSMENNGAKSQVFVDTCVVDADGSLDLCGGHFPCAANKAMTAAGQLVYGFNGEGWHGAEANQWLHFDAATGLFVTQFGTVNGIHDPAYADAGWAAPGSAGNAFSGTLVTVGGGGSGGVGGNAAAAAGGGGGGGSGAADGSSSVTVYLYHNDESAHGGVHRWRLRGLDGLERVRVPVSLG